MKIRLLTVIFATLILLGCASFKVDVMSRADGKIYHGTAQKVADGQATMQLDIAGVEYSGMMVRTSSEEYMSFVNSFANTNRGVSASAFGAASVIGANATFTAILSAPNGNGLRCALQGDRMSGTGSGYCVDVKNNGYDISYHLPHGGN